MAVFLARHHGELFIDPDRTDISALREGLSREVKEGRIMHPFIWGRELYDKAFTQISDDSLHMLDSKRTLDFLRGTSHGVFQLSDTIVGPWGALPSAEHRSAPPVLAPRLYHCERPGCLRAHKTRLNTSENSIITMRHRLAKKLHQRGAASNWNKLLGPLQMKQNGYHDDWRSEDLLGFLGECFSLAELKEVAKSALSDRALAFREVCRLVGIQIRGADAFLAERSYAEIMQLLLLLTDRDLMKVIDRTILEGGVAIPSGEIRRARLNGRMSGYFDTRIECSNRGVRVSSGNPNTAMYRLRRLISEVYGKSDLSSHLDWKLRQTEGKSRQERLDRYIDSNSNSDVVRDLFLSGPDVFGQAVDHLSMVNVEKRSEDDLVSMFTWKLGFPQEIEDRGASELRGTSEALRSAANEFDRYGEEERNEIRSSAPNLFVALEKTLDQALVFSTWITTFDHWTATPRSTFFADDARRYMASLLTEYSSRKGETVEFNPDGVNTLFPLISGFGLLASYLEREGRRPENHARNISDIPRVFNESNLLDFAYPFKLPYLNFSEESRVAFIGYLREISRELSNGKISTVRNGLSHHKEEFPTKEQIVACVKAIGRVSEIIEKLGILPLTFKMKSFLRDSEGRSFYTYEDYSGRQIKMPTTAPIVVTGAPARVQNQIIVPGLTLAGSNESPRFSIGIRSDYTRLWQDWPRLRTLPDGFSETPQEDLDRGDDLPLESSGNGI